MIMSMPQNFLRCSRCGKQVSTLVPHNTIVRAWIECPECVVNWEEKLIKQE